MRPPLRIATVTPDLADHMLRWSHVWNWPLWMERHAIDQVVVVERRVLHFPPTPTEDPTDGTAVVTPQNPLCPACQRPCGLSPSGAAWACATEECPERGWPWLNAALPVVWEGRQP